MKAVPLNPHSNIHKAGNTLKATPDLGPNDARRPHLRSSSTAVSEIATLRVAVHVLSIIHPAITADLEGSDI